MEPTFEVTQNELAATLHAVLDEREKVRKERSQLKSVSIHQAAKRLGRADATIKKMIAKGMLRTTPDGRVTLSALEDFIDQSQKL